MMMPCISPAGQVAPLLISLAVGYGVLVLAKREARPLNRIGKVVGWLVMAVALVGLICIASSRLYRMCPSHGGAGKAAMCLMPPEAAAPVANDDRGAGDSPRVMSPADRK